MGATTDMLRTTLGETGYKTLVVLADSSAPMSGRTVATELGVSPTTATSALRRLHGAGFATFGREGRADRWRLNTDNTVLRSWLEERRDAPHRDNGATAMHPYATGGGGVTFERKVAVQYLAHLLVGDAASDLGEGRLVVSVAFQQSPEHAVDDLVIHAARGDELEPSLVLALGVRRVPNLVAGNEATKKLIRAFVREVNTAPADGSEHRVALVVAGAQDHAKQLASLADIASKQMDALKFFALVRTHAKYSGAVRGRLKHIEALVRQALVDLGVADPGPQVTQERTWELLARLQVLMPRLETPDDADWAAVTNALTRVARGGDLYGASRLRDRLVALVAEYSPAAAAVDLSLLRRDAHEVVDLDVRRHRQGWQALGHLHERAIASTRDEIASGDGSRKVHLDRGDATAALLALTDSGNAGVVVHGDSGTGKSTLAIRAATGAMSSHPDSTQAVCINLRHLPGTTLALESFLQVRLQTLLAELSASRRLLVIDGADAISEGMFDLFRYLVDAGLGAGVTVVAVTASDTKQLVLDSIAERSIGAVVEYLVSPLTDSEVDTVIGTFGELAALATNPRSRELLRRPVVVDLLVRGGLTGTPLSDVDAMRQVWAGLVRRYEKSDRGTPDAREFALLRLADLALCGGDVLDVVASIDPTALAGLRHDGLLRPSVDDPFKVGPEFAHDELRRYAVARLMLAAGDATSKLVGAGVPRWALGAARLACQAVLVGSNSPSNPLLGRFAYLQTAFDDLVKNGYGDRWGDVPGEALLTLGDPDPVLQDAWVELCAEPGAGLQRLTRLVDQRLRDHGGMVRVVAVEPLISLLLNEEAPWSAGAHIRDLLRDWLRALIVAGAPASYPLRVRLRDRLVAACEAADERQREQQEAAAGARAARSPEQIEEERRAKRRYGHLFTEIGYPRSPRRDRPELPHDITEEIVVELLALLGPDLGGGEAILSRVARDAPSWLSPAVEGLFTGRALAMCRRGLLADMTEAYYVDHEEDGSGFHEDGIRDHRARGFGAGPLAAWYRGPFMALFQSDFRSGVAMLNRMLNHAAIARARTLAGLGHYGGPIDDRALDVYRTELDLTGTRLVYVGDSHVWTWYRGTGVGPYPCMSGLQALERVCDQLVASGISLPDLARTLLDGCQNLAMVGLVVGLLVRHLERADRSLDPCLTEPMIWNLEFSRVVQESSGLAASSEGIAAPERRQWSLREAAMLMVLRADDARSDQLRLSGQHLVANAQRLFEAALGDVDDSAIEEQLVAVRGWASGLDRSTYETHEAEAGVIIQSRLPEEIALALEAQNAGSRLAHEATRLIVRYHIKPKQGPAEVIGEEALRADLAVARELLDSPPVLHTMYQWDAPAAVAAAAIEANFLEGITLPADSLGFAVDTVLRVGEGEIAPRQFESEESYFEMGADRSAARVLPLILLPAAAGVRASLDGQDGSRTYGRALGAAGNLACVVANEVRVHLARGLDRLWTAPCAVGGACHHAAGLELAVTSMRDCAFGAWDPDMGRRHIIALADPVPQALTATSDEAIYFPHLDAAIRALAPAAMAGICVSDAARELLHVLLAAHRRALLAHENDMDSRGTHALVAARALLTVAATGDDDPLFEHINAYSDNATLLNGVLRALSAAAEETSGRASTARRIWPRIVSHVIGLHEAGRKPFRGRHYGEYALAALIPNPAGEVTYLHREIEHEPIAWWDPAAWQTIVELWLPHARGNATCVDHLISFLSPLDSADQARLGVPWIADLVLADSGSIANRCFLLSSWLIEVRSAAADVQLLASWQRVVDALVVSGADRLAPYSE